MTIAWTEPGGGPISCRDKLRMLQDNHAELEQVMRDTFEDAVLMGVDPEMMRGVLHRMIEQMRLP